MKIYLVISCANQQTITISIVIHQQLTEFEVPSLICGRGAALWIDSSLTFAFFFTSSAGAVIFELEAKTEVTQVEAEGQNMSKSMASHVHGHYSKIYSHHH